MIYQAIGLFSLVIALQVMLAASAERRLVAIKARAMLLPSRRV